MIDGKLLQAVATFLNLPFYAFLGAFTLYLLNRLQNKVPFSLFKGLNVNVGATAHPIIVLLDMILSSIIGAVVVVALTSPGTVPQAIISGLGMTGILSVHTKEQ